MYLPLDTVITATSLLTVSQLNDLNLATNNLPLSASSVTLIARQDEAKPPPPPFITSIHTASAGTSASTATTVPTQTSHPEANAGPWLSAGKIGGIVVGSVFGLIILGLIIYTLLAASRGINVCDCFGGCCGKHDDDDENVRERLPSRSDDTYPRPDVLHSGPGEGYKAYRPARLSGDNPLVPLPLVLPQQTGTQQRRAGRLQRGYRGVEV
ncbi:unnamed protein product [Alternaria alternata]